MKKYLLPESGNFYKANLHCHSTVSDGKWTVEEIKKNYMEQGYSIVAFTDHDVLIPHYELNDENFLALNGVEFEFDEGGKWGKQWKNCHFCAIALEPDNITQPCWHREKYQFSNAVNYRDKVKFDDSEADWEREYSPECISRMMKNCREKGFFVTYNHPTWSMEGYRDYMGYNGMHAMEVCNYGCVSAGFDDRNSKEYDEMLRGGKRIYCIATDDNHNGRADSFGGFTMIKAEKLEYKTVTDALLKGNFYASEGPIINALWFEDGKVHITFEPARKAFITKGVRGAKIAEAQDGGLITEAVFDVEEDDIYFRITVETPDGKRAYTNAYFPDDIVK